MDVAMLQVQVVPRRGHRSAHVGVSLASGHAADRIGILKEKEWWPKPVQVFDHAGQSPCRLATRSRLLIRVGPRKSLREVAHTKIATAGTGQPSGFLC